MKTEIVFDQKNRPVYSHLEPIVEILLKNGNSLTKDFRWGENRTGFYCYLSNKIDFDLIERSFDLPNYVRLDRENDAIECDLTWASIKGGMSKFTTV